MRALPPAGGGREGAVLGARQRHWRLPVQHLRGARPQPDDLHELAVTPGPDYLAALVCAALLSHRSRTRPALRPAALAVVAFCLLDAARLAGLPPCLDVVAFEVIPACWMGLLCYKSDTRASVRAVPATETAEDGGLGSARAAVSPALACLLYASLLLLTRHHPAVAAHWQAWLQVPRLVGLGWALGVLLRHRRPRADARREARPRRGRDEVVEGRIRPEGGRGDERGEGIDGDGRGVAGAGSAREIFVAEAHAHSLPPSLAIGCALSLSAGISAAGGLWGDWGEVRVMSLGAWLVVAWVGVRARGP